MTDQPLTIEVEDDDFVTQQEFMDNHIPRKEPVTKTIKEKVQGTVKRVLKRKKRKNRK